ncbi:MerR family transcriptional regulator [Streptomyces kaniharaensis]|uniref:MerR family transcriptional regulator n=1 Tax=Streptomyces kaniharaensis TaxID=212423 RepID=A0A6N7KJA8_9ACTN|nr:MerR family transcriptional regulator [Streptomyces kaniharaensis]MQS11602.1 MerR family transcriptional regulator [Streptomyces kaniharaensis]
MAWPIAEVARMSGVTARTLRHYDEIGLLPPAWIGSNGHRYYEERQLLQLQQILVLRALGVGLPEIARILGDQVDELEALRSHHDRLLAERDRLDALAATVSRTIAELEQSRKDGTPMTSINRPENLFEGIQHTDVEDSLRDFPEHAEAALRATAAMSQAEVEAGQRERTTQMIRLAELMTAGHPADAEPVQRRIDTEYRALTALRPVSVEEYRAIARAVVENAQWRAAYEAIAPGLAAYQRAAMEAYAVARLS